MPAARKHHVGGARIGGDQFDRTPIEHFIDVDLRVGEDVHELIDLQISDFLQASLERLVPCAAMRSEELSAAGIRLVHSSTIAEERHELERFLFERVYRHPRLLAVRHSAESRLERLYESLVIHPPRLPLRFRLRGEQIGWERAAGEYLAGMTDRFCDAQYLHLQTGSGPLADWS